MTISFASFDNDGEELLLDMDTNRDGVVDRSAPLGDGGGPVGPVTPSGCAVASAPRSTSCLGVLFALVLGAVVLRRRTRR